MPSGSAARIPAHDETHEAFFSSPDGSGRPDAAPVKPLRILLVVPTLETGAADHGVVDLTRILAIAGHHPIVLSRGGRLQDMIAAHGGEFLEANVASKNPFVIVRNIGTIMRIARKYRCDIVHAHGRAPAWSAYVAARLAGLPFVTSWYKGFREQNPFKRLYNSVMVRGDRIIAGNDQLADLICDRYGVAADRIDVVPATIDFKRFSPDSVSPESVDAVRRSLGVAPGTRMILVAGRMIRRKGHHIVVQAARRLKDMGMKDFICIFAGEDRGRSRYMGEVWDLVLSSDTADVVRIVGPLDDLPAAYMASSVVISAATQPEGLQRAILEAQAMARPVIVSDLGAGPDVVLAPPAVPEDRMTGLRFPAGDDAALAAALIRLFSMTDSARLAMGQRGRGWVSGHFTPPNVATLTLKVYADLAKHWRIA